MFCLVYLQVGAVLEPNPGVCGLESRTENGVTFDEYVNDALYVSFQKQKAAMYVCLTYTFLLYMPCV